MYDYAFGDNVLQMESRRVKWIPHSGEDREAVNEAVEKILSSPQFRNSKRYPDFLRYIVEQALNGSIDQIKERTVGIEVFGRAPDYDTNTDTVVRYTAGEVRKRLALYYSSASNDPIQIILSPRSYHPEFHRLVEESTALEHVALPEVNHSPVPAQPAYIHKEEPEQTAARPARHRFALACALVLLGALLVWSGSAAWTWYRSIIPNRFWSPITQAKEPVLVGLGGVVFSAESEMGTKVADSTSENPYLSFESGLALGRVASLLSSRGADYLVRPSATLTLAQFHEGPAVLIGAYNNVWTERMLAPLRFHFSDLPNEAIVDGWHPGTRWSRDRAQPFSDKPDYGLVARFRNPSTDSMVLILAGLQRYGTDAASQFVTSPHFLELLDKQIGANWKDKNIEIVLRVDVVNGRAGTPIIERVHTW